MKNLIILLLVFCVQMGADGQSIDPELRLKLQGKTKFQDIKSTVWSHLTGKLALLNETDTLERKAIMRQMKRWNREFWINEYYTNANGEVEPQSKVITNALNHRKKEEQKSGSGSRTQVEGWVQNGPISTNFGLVYGEGVGRIDRLAFHPTQPNVLFAGSPHGGLFKTTNSGEEWFPISEYVASLGVSGIAVHPVNPDTIYVLSGDGDSSDDGLVNSYNYRSQCNGVYKSTNGGMTWRKLSEFPGVADTVLYRGRNLIIDPTNPLILYAATSLGLFRTNNGGLSWINVVPGVNIWDVKIKPGNSNYVYCVGNNFFRRSVDGGLSFTPIFIEHLDPATRISMAVTPANPSKIALLAGKNTNPNSLVGVFISTDSGGNFDRTYYDNSDNLFFNYIDLNVTNNQIDYDNVIAISPVNENIILAGGLCLWRSEDGGYDWSQETAYWATSDGLHEYIHPDQHSLMYHPINNKLYVANDGGVYVSDNNGDDFEFMQTGLSVTQFYHFEEENDEDDSWGGAQDIGILVRLNYNEFTVDRGGDGYDIMTDHVSRCSDGNSENVFCTVNESIYTDGFALGGYIDISVPNNTNFFGNLAMHPENCDIIYVGYTSHVWKGLLTMAGVIWEPLGRPGNWSICAGKNNPDRLYSAGTNGVGTGLWRTDDGGDIWTQINSNLLSLNYDSAKITDIEIDRFNDDHVYISCAGTIPNSKVYESTNAGAVWTNISFNLPNVPVFCLLRDPSGGLYAGTSIGVYYKRAGIDYWEPFYNELPPVPVTQIVFEEEESIFVHCSTFGRGLWRTLKYSSDCAENLNLTGNPVGRKYFEVSNNINSNQNIQGPGTHIILSAGNKITLTEGMNVKEKAVFKAYVQPCGGEVDLSVQTSTDESKSRPELIQKKD